MVFALPAQDTNFLNIDTVAWGNMNLTARTRDTQTN